VSWNNLLRNRFLIVLERGIVSTFGVFQTFYKEQILSTETYSSISWIGSVQAALLLFLLLVAGPAHDSGYCKPMMYVGTFLIVLGMMMTSFCKSYWQFMLAQGVCIGVGNGIVFITSVAIIPTYFSARRGVAAGIAASGSSFG
jgi:MFS family permease